VHVAGRLGYLQPQQVEALEDAVRATAAPLIGLIRQQVRRQLSPAHHRERAD
jgi:hypothetical protein